MDTKAAVAAPAFGVGVYSFPQAARLIEGASPHKLRRWVRTGLTPPTFQRSGPSDVLSFLDVVSLEVVRRMRLLGVSLQKVRILESELRRDHPDATRPFALDVFWTDGVQVWYELEPGDSRLVQGTGRQRGQLSWVGAVGAFAQEIRYEGGVAASWHPSDHVAIDPRVRFGEPVVAGTRIAVATIVANLEEGSPDDVARWFDLTVEQVRDAEGYGKRLG